MKYRRVLVACLAILAFVAGSASSASAEGPEEPEARVEQGPPESRTGPSAGCFPAGCSTDAEADEDGDGDEFTMAASGSNWQVTCTGINEQAHYSYGAGGAIYKTRITCTGHNVSSVYVNYNSVLRFAPAIGCYTGNLNWSTRATSRYNQWVTVNGATKTFYTPRPGSHGGEGVGWWNGSHSHWFTHAGVRSTTGSDHDYWCLDLRP